MLLSSVTAGVAKLESDAVRSGKFLKSKEQIKHVQRRIYTSWRGLLEAFLNNHKFQVQTSHKSVQIVFLDV